MYKNLRKRLEGMGLKQVEITDRLKQLNLPGDFLLMTNGNLYLAFFNSIHDQEIIVEIWFSYPYTSTNSFIYLKALACYLNFLDKNNYNNYFAYYTETQEVILNRVIDILKKVLDYKVLPAVPD